MIRFVWALIGLRWQLLRNTLRGGKGRDSLERFSRVIALIVPGFLAVSMALTAMAPGLLALTGGFLGSWGSVRASC